MDTTYILNELAKNAEPIQGYVLKHRIGVGGNGEVWEATAPGGLRKAIKFVHGSIDQKRASRELASLNRIRELSHPFLLTVERIEIVDHRLMIVTELAEESLEDLFEQYRGEGLAGIPRDELLRYMREAADALDYLFTKQSLQHLDVKPGNILLVSKHVKVADFGLLKDLQDNGASLIHGLTPKYASPELFAGRPCRHSDQYSLAILYQAMLTGQFPFSGHNAAQLASQHLHCTPDVSALSPHERFAVSKALSKDPSQRFSSCCEFVDRLTNRSTAKMITSLEKGNSSQSRLGVNAGGRGAAPPSSNGFRQHDGHTIVVAEPEVTSLPALDLSSSVATYRPTIFVGIGGTAGRVLTQLRQLLTDRFGSVADIPAFQFVYLDTDKTAINDAVAREDGGALQESDTLLLPLRPTSDYRGGELTDIKSISRRWIYNIPRSLTTSGLRALGRIALLDHSKRAVERLRSAILAATNSNSLAASSKETGLTFSESDPRVFVIASAAGGTGSGMVIDVGYAVRQILAESGLSDDEVCGILTYSTPKGVSTRNLAAANAYTCLDELRHFCNPVNDYPGELSRGLAGFREDSATFKSTYLVDFGDELSNEQFNDATDRLADYLFLNSASPAISFFDACRDVQRQHESANRLSLRTFGLRRYGSDSDKIPPGCIELLCKSVVRNWRGGATAARDDDRINLADVERLFVSQDASKPNAEIEALTQGQLMELGVNLGSINTRVASWIQEELCSDIPLYLEKIIAESVNKSRSAGADLESQFSTSLNLINSIVGIEDALGQQTDSQFESLCELVMPKARELGGSIGGKLKKVVLDLVDNDQARVDGARQAVLCLSSLLKAVESEAALQYRTTEEELAKFQQQFAKLRADRKFKKQAKKSNVLEEQLLIHANLLVKRLIAASTSKTVKCIEPHITASSDELRLRWKDLNQLAEEFRFTGFHANEKANHSASDVACEPNSEFAQFFESHQAEMIERLNAEIESKFFNKTRRLCDVLSYKEQARAAFITKLRTIARKVILQARKEYHFRYLSGVVQKGELASLTEPLKACLDVSEPELQTAGGAKRLLVTLPEGLTSKLKDEIQKISGDQVTPVCDSEAGVLICYEVEDLSFDGVAAKFIRRHPECQEISRRLHTRVDVAWSDG